MQLGYLFDRSIELCLQANPSIYAVRRPASGMGNRLMDQRDDMQYCGFDVLGPILWIRYFRRTRQ